MSLTMTLAILAGLVLVAVIVQGLWSARRAGPRRPPVDGRRRAGRGEHRSHALAR
jgi:FtsZ-interacting cell division protein ZipA